MKMEDIATIAGVSKSAVSLALSGKPGIGKETREKILRIAHENGYLPRTRGNVEELAVKKTVTFLAFANSGIVLETYYHQPFFRELIHFIEERCRSLGYKLIFSTINIDKLDEQITALSEENQSQGVILLGTNLERQHIADITNRLSLPLVVLDNCYHTLPVHFVEINNMIGAYQAGKHLCILGHRHIGYIASIDRIHNFEERKRGFAYALKEYGVKIVENCTFSVEPTILSSQDALRQQLQSYIDSGSKLPSAFFCECDYIAISAIKTLTEMGYNVPGDISIAGFDNITEAMIVSPELTTVHVDKERMAYLAVDLLARAIETNDISKTKIAVDTHFVERQSVRKYN